MTQKQNGSVRFLTETAVIAAMYAVLTLFVAPIAYGSYQFRISEALTILPIFTPAAIPGLTIGCFIANLSSELGMIDWIVGPLATLSSAICTYLVRNVRFKTVAILAPLPPVVFNTIIIGVELTVVYSSPTLSTFLPLFLPMALSVGLGEFVVCYVLGIPLSLALEKSTASKYIFGKYGNKRISD